MKKYFIVLALVGFLLADSFLVSALEKVYSVKVSVDKSYSVGLENIKMWRGHPYDDSLIDVGKSFVLKLELKYGDGSSDYAYFIPFFYILTDPPTELDNVEEVIYLKYKEGLQYVRVYDYQSNEKLSVNVEGKFCNSDLVCNNYENYYSCPSDCLPGDEDGICASDYKDRICDKDCINDYDCPANLYGKVLIAPLGKNQSDEVNVEILYENNKLYIKNAVSDFNGSFVLEDLPQDKIIDMTIKPKYYLRKKAGLSEGFNFENLYNDFFDFGDLRSQHGDFNDDNKVDFFDMAPFSGSYGSSCGQTAYKWYVDYNRDCKINFFDMSPFSGSWGKTGVANLQEPSLSPASFYFVPLIIAIVLVGIVLFIVWKKKGKKRR